MILRWLMLALVGGLLGACGQAGPLYLPEEEVSTEAVEITETVAGEQVVAPDGTVQTIEAGAVEVSDELSDSEVEQVETPHAPGELGPGETPLGPGE